MDNSGTRFFRLLTEQDLLWYIVPIVLFALLGAMAATGKVIVFESNSDGTGVFTKQCITYDHESASMYSETVTSEEQAATAPDFCLRYGDVAIPLKERLTNQIPIYAFFGSILGFVIGSVAAQWHTVTKRRKAQDAMRQDA